MSCGDNMPEPITERIAALPKLDRVALHDLWKQIFNASPSSQLRKDLMIPILAYQIQEQAFGPLSAANHSRLRQLARSFEKDSDSAIPSVPSHKSRDAAGPAMARSGPSCECGGAGL
jgi:hypothetical protein